MTYRIIVQPSGYSFIVQQNETILEAALRCGFFFPHNCRLGVCATCKGKIISGEIDYDGLQILGLTGQEKNAGYALFCSAKPKSDMTIYVEDFARVCPSVDRESEMTMSYQVIHQESFSQNITQIILQAPDKVHLHYQAGQYVKVLHENDLVSPMSIACAPFDLSVIELHLFHPQQNLSAHNLLRLVKEKKQLVLQGPYGKCTAARFSLDKPIIFIARNTGFAPIKAIMEEFLQIRNLPDIYFYWCANDSAELYLESLVSSWAREMKNFHYTPVFNASVETFIFKNHPDLSNYQTYVVEAYDVTTRLLAIFMQHGLTKENFYSDIIPACV